MFRNADGQRLRHSRSEGGDDEDAMEHASKCHLVLPAIRRWDLSRGCLTGGDGLLLCTMAWKSVMVFVFGAQKFARLNDIAQRKAR